MNKVFISIFLAFIVLLNQVMRLNANDDTYINSSNITYNEEKNIVELAENSKINFKNTNILIDKGIIDYDKNKFEVFGNFYLYEEFTILSGQNLKGNTNLNIFSADNVSYLYSDELKIDSEKLKRNENTLYFYNNFLTPCELEGYFNCPTWSLRIDKTKYNIEEDKFTHFDTFLQIADYKVFYLPYFSHYGEKAPRKRGFLTPTIEFTVGGDQNIIIPYYLPINQSTDILFNPRISLSQNIEFTEKYQLNTLIETKNARGDTLISINNIKDKNNEDIKSSLKIDTKQVINKNNIFSASGLFTNSISTTRSVNEEPITFEDIYLRFENYNIITDNDFLKSELSSVESFESTNINTIPILPSLSYINFYNFENYSLINNFEFVILNRDESSINNPSESFKIGLKNELSKYLQGEALSFYNKLYLNNNYSEYSFNSSQFTNHNSYKSNSIFSSDLNFNKIGNTTPRLKFIIPFQFKNTNKSINEDSESITFNYQNQFSENRFFGNDLFDSSPRIVYGLENSLYLNDMEFNLNVNQIFEAEKNNNYANKINQNSRFSDYSIETELILDNASIKLDTRLDNDNYSKKEMNYKLNFNKFLKTSIIYNETQSEAFKEYSNDTQSVILNVSKVIKENVKLNINSNLDVKNNYDPYTSILKLSLFDECSQLDISYKNVRYNDNFNTLPEEKIGITFSMDYLGFFGYEQTTNLFLDDTENKNNEL